MRAQMILVYPRKLASSLVLKAFEHEEYFKDTRLPLHRTQCGNGKTGREKGRKNKARRQENTEKTPGGKEGAENVAEMLGQSSGERKLKGEGEKESARGK